MTAYVEFQFVDVPDDVQHLQVVNITHAAFVLQWTAGFNGGAEQTFHVVLHGEHTEEQRTTNTNEIRFDDLNANTNYNLSIRSSNIYGSSNQSTRLTVRTAPMPSVIRNLPSIEQIYTVDNRYNRVRIRLNHDRLERSSLDDVCLRQYDRLSSCLSLRSIQMSDNEFEFDMEMLNNQRLQFCYINQSDVCSKSWTMPIGVARTRYSSDWILTLIGR
jgi:hypothetical protein